MSAQPLGGGPKQGEGDDSGQALELQRPYRLRNEAGKEGEHGGQAAHRHRHQPPERGDVDHQGEGNPIEPDHEETEAEPPAEREGGALALDAIEQPEQARNRDQQDRQGADRRLGQGGQDAEQESRAPPLPTGGGG